LEEREKIIKYKKLYKDSIKRLKKYQNIIIDDKEKSQTKHKNLIK